MDEAPLHPTDTGLVPQGAGWFVLNATEAPWLAGDFGVYTRFEGEDRFPDLGINISVLQPGESLCYYHAEDAQEDFLVLDGECVLLVEGQERPLRRWDLVHCPAWTEHVILGAGDGPSVVLATGTRTEGGVVYPDSELARRHGAGAARETRDSKEAYADVADDVPAAYEPGWLPGA